MASAFPHVLTDNSLTFYVEGKQTQIHSDHPKFQAVLKAVLDGDETAITLAKPAVTIANQVTAATNGTDAGAQFRRKAGVLTVNEWGVSLNGESLHGVVIDRLLAVLAAGADISSWVNFITKLYQNPSHTSRSELYLWLEAAEMPITADGDFLAYKKVRADYMDIHSGRFDNSPGQVLEMSRLDVDDDRNKTCSAGLHFCSKSYLPSFGGGAGNRVVLVKINPADVVSIPSDYNNAKGRTWRYEVVEDVTDTERVWGPVADGYGDDDADNEYDYYGDDDEDLQDEDDPADRILIGQVFEAYGAKFTRSSKDEPERSVRILRANHALGLVDSGDEIESFGDLTIADALVLLTAWA